MDACERERLAVPFRVERLGLQKRNLDKVEARLPRLLDGVVARFGSPLANPDECVCAVTYQRDLLSWF